MFHTLVPDAIEYARPETAIKDLGIKVLLCHWEDAIQFNVNFGVSQALIYNGVDEPKVESEMSRWLNDHPFILTPLESKGLEFDDVVVAFDIERKAWDVKPSRISSLKVS